MRLREPPWTPKWREIGTVRLILGEPCQKWAFFRVNINAIPYGISNHTMVKTHFFTNILRGYLIIKKRENLGFFPKKA